MAPGVDLSHPTQVFILTPNTDVPKNPKQQKTKDSIKMRAILDVWTKYYENKVKRVVGSTWQVPVRVLRGGNKWAGL